MRKLTKFFGSYKLAKYQKEHKCSLLELIEFSDIDINTLLVLIKLGHPDLQGKHMTDEEAAEILDQYLQDEENNYITAYLDLVEELDRDIHLFKGFGVKMSDLKAKMNSKITEVKQLAEMDQVENTEPVEN